MSIEVVNTFPDFLAFWEAAQSRPLKEQQRLWQQRYEDRHRAVFDLYYRVGGSPEALDAALLRFPQAVPPLQARIDAILAVLEAAAARGAGAFCLPITDVQIVLLVGLFAAIGWTDAYQDIPTIFLAVEQLQAPLYAEIVVAHEVAHIVHERCSEATWTRAECTIGQTLFEEGLAVAASVIANPGYSESEYLWMAPGYDDQLAACHARWPAFLARLPGDLESRDPDVHAVYFSPPAAGDSAPERVGFYVGHKLITALGEKYSLAEMARWSPPRALAEVRNVISLLEA